MQDHQPGGGLIIFDESTRAMGKAARGRFFGLVRSVIDGGASVLMISHQLEEVVEVTDRVTVLRDGQVVETGIPTKDIDEAGLTRLMLGRHLVTHNRVDSHASGRGGGPGAEPGGPFRPGPRPRPEEGRDRRADRACRLGRGRGRGGDRRRPPGAGGRR